MTDTIFALSSGAPPAAIAVLRISGPDADAALEKLAGKLPDYRYLSLRTLRDPDSGEALDQALVARFPDHGSVTGEPLAELHLHGSRATVSATERTLAAMGLRQARAGEFTWRAFKNGRVNLVQVESLSDLLRSETESQRRAALAGEGLSRKIEVWRERLLLLSALVEAALDQSDEDDVPADGSRIMALAEAIDSEVSEFLVRPSADRLFEGVRVVFAGPPNAGKSTLINALAQREVAITSPVAGTTRDVIEAPIQLNGVPFVLTDTAGLREGATDAIEQEGMDRARRQIDVADMIIWLGDGPAPSSMTTDKLIAVAPKADQAGRQSSGRLAVSAITGEGLPELIETMVRRARDLLPGEGEVALNRRQRAHLAALSFELTAFVDERDELIAAERLRLCRAEIDALAGRAGTEEMLDALFGAFCIGK